MILNRQRAVRVARQPLEAFLKRVLGELDLGNLDLTICLVGDEEIARLNEAFRGKRGPTDVLSFPEEKRRRASAKKSKGTRPHATMKPESAETKWPGASQAGAGYLGDVAIAPETARRYAKRNGRTLKNELRVLIIHGVLHLLGYDHETDDGEMNRLERKLRRRFGLA
jgi:probable rRNA maturation factor